MAFQRESVIVNSCVGVIREKRKKHKITQLNATDRRWIQSEFRLLFFMEKLFRLKIARARIIDAQSIVSSQSVSGSFKFKADLQISSQQLRLAAVISKTNFSAQPMSGEDVSGFPLLSTRSYILMNEHAWPGDVTVLYNIRGNMFGFCDDALSSGCEDSSIGRSEFSFTKLSVSCKQTHVRFITNDIAQVVDWFSPLFSLRSNFSVLDWMISFFSIPADRVTNFSAAKAVGRL